MEQLILHLFGDYVTQSDWMANNKTKSSYAAAAHALVYSLPFFLFLYVTRATPRPFLAGVVILATHFLIDRFRLARYMAWAKNLISPKATWFCDSPESANAPHNPACPTERCDYCRKVRTLPWKECSATGYPPDRPIWLAVWLLIVADNTLHLAINYAALKWL
jgi:hypothetical protein